MSHNRSLAEKRNDIIQTLKWLKIPTEEIAEELNQAKTISVPVYLNKYLIGSIPELYEKRKEDDAKFCFLIQLCFTGDLPGNTLNKIWNQLEEDEKIRYAAIHYHLGDPLEIAAIHGNLAALKILAVTYQQLLAQHSDLRFRVHYQLRMALGSFPKYMQNQKHVSIYHFLLELCEKIATLIQPSSANTGFSNKQFDYCIRDGVVEFDRATPLLDVFADLCTHYFVEARSNEVYLGAINKLSHFIHSKVTDEEFIQFKEKLLVLLEAKHNYSADKYQSCWDALEDQEEWLLDLPRLENDEIDHWRESSKYQREIEGFAEIWKDEQYKTDAERIIALLHDYTKEDHYLPGVYRFFSGHWNRHHIKEVSEICAQRGVKSAEELLLELETKICLENSEGTIATLIDFLEQKIGSKDNALIKQSRPNIDI